MTHRPRYNAFVSATHGKQAGFTLLEVSIVLIIIGLITGTIIVGQSMIRQAKITSVADDFVRYSAAMRNFQNKYNALPGDFATATQTWGAAGSPTNTSSCYTVASTGKETCDGNGDGKIALCGYEDTRAWQHMANAELIEGKYPQSGTSCASGVDVPGTDLPRSRLSGAVFLIGWFGYYPSGSTTEFPGNYGHSISIDNATSYFGGVGTMSAEEALSIDRKLDDGMPAFGNIVALHGRTVGNTCVTSTDPTTAQYNTSDSSTNSKSKCGIFYKTGL